MSCLTTSALKVAPALADAIDVATGASAWVNGAWVEFITATAGPVQLAGLVLGSPRAYANVDIRIEIGIGLAGSEVAVGALRLFLPNSAVGGDGVHLFQAPLNKVSAGTRVSLRAAGSPGTPFTQSFALLYYDALDSDHFLTAATLTDAPQQAAMVSAAVNTTAWANSNWFQLVASTATESMLAGLALRINPASVDFEIDLGTGAAAAEVVRTTLRGGTCTGNAGFFQGIELPALLPVPAGTRIAVRVRKSGTDADPVTFALRYYTGTAVIVTAPPAPADPCPFTAPRFVTVLDDGVTAYNSSKVALRNSSTYPGGRLVGFVPPRDLHLGMITRRASDWLTGAWSAQSVSIIRADTDRALRNARFSFKGMQGYVYLVDNVTRLSEGTGWRLLFQGPVQSSTADPALTMTHTLNDPIANDYSLLRDEVLIPQRTVTVDDFPNRPIDTDGYGVPICVGDVDSGDVDACEVKLFHVGQITYNGLTKDCWLVAGHACQTITLSQGVTAIPTNDPEAWWPGSDNWTDFVPSNAKFLTINGHTYAVVFLDGTRATNAIDGSEPLYANIQGYTTSALGTGTLIEDLHTQYYDLLTQWILQSYETGPWPTAPTFDFYPGSLVTLDRVLASSFTDASTLAAGYLAGGFKGAFVLGAGGARIAVRDLVAQFNINGNVLLALNQYSQLFIKMLDRTRTTFLAGHRTITDRVDILKAPAFHPVDEKQDWHFNDYVTRYGQNYRDDGTGEWHGRVEHANAPSIVTYGRTIVMVQELSLIRDADTASTVNQERLDFAQDPPREVTYAQSLCGLEREVLDGEPITHYGGVAAAGWVDRALWITEETIDPQACVVIKKAIDVDNLLS